MPTSRQWISLPIALSLILLLSSAARAQELGGAGTFKAPSRIPRGRSWWPSMSASAIPCQGFTGTPRPTRRGRFVFRNLPPNPYHLEVTRKGSRRSAKDVDVRTSVPIELDLTMALAGAATTVEVVGHGTDLLERDPTAHTDIDQTLVDKLPIESSAGLNQVITLASPGVVADANGFFHPIGDHAQTQFSIDNQPVTDQQSRIYSNQISPDAVQSMEVITGVPPAEFGDKDSLVVRIVTKSGLDQSKPSGSVSGGYGSFSTSHVDGNVGVGNDKVGNFLSFSGVRTDRFLDPPEFETLHGDGDSQSLFDRFDLHPSDSGHRASQCVHGAGPHSTCPTPTTRTRSGRISTRRSPPSTSRRATHASSARIS